MKDSCRANFHLGKFRERLAFAPGGRLLFDKSLERLSTLIADCRTLQNRAHRGQKRLGSIHHFACTGGTLISRAIASQPNVVLLSEMDPYSTLSAKRGTFSPKDILGVDDIGIRTYSRGAAEPVFLAGLKARQKHALKTGQGLIVRDHPHSHFCTDQAIASRPLMGDLLRRNFELRSMVTVRHPLDSFLSLLLKGWVHFSPGTLEEYARRYHTFLDFYAESHLFRYEDFVLDPDRLIEEIAIVLGIPVASNWKDILPGVVLSGDSGRAGGEIAPRPRREIPYTLQEQENSSPTYSALCERLGYNSGFQTRPIVGWR